MTNYVTGGRPTIFFTIVDTALARNVIAIGYRKIAYAKDAQRRFDIVVNPKKSEWVNYEESGQIIVLAQQ